MKDRIILLPYLEAAAYDEFRGIVGDAAPSSFAEWKRLIDRTGLNAAIRSGATVRYAGVDFADLRQRLGRPSRPTSWDELLPFVAGTGGDATAASACARPSEPDVQADGRRPIRRRSMRPRFALPAGIKRALPKRLRRFLLLHVLQVNRHYAALLKSGSRLCMEDEILPWVRARYSSVLFVGTAPYTHHYERLFRRDQYTTIDADPATAVWGADHHIVAPVQDINRHRPGGFFDCLILNGVLGFGIDTVEDMRTVLREAHRALRPGGALVVGWNTNLHDDPEAMGLYAGRFVRNDAPWPERRRFPPETHVYDVYERCPDR